MSSEKLIVAACRKGDLSPQLQHVPEETDKSDPLGSEGETVYRASLAMGAPVAIVHQQCLVNDRGCSVVWL